MPPLAETLFITGNTGIHLFSSVAAGSTITGNIIIDNITLDSGIHIEEGVNAANVGVYVNNIDKNGPYGILNESTTGVLDARNNWWGSPTGPSGVGTGSGDSVSINVNFTPWLMLPYSEYKHLGLFKPWPYHPWPWFWPLWPKP